MTSPQQVIENVHNSEETFKNLESLREHYNYTENRIWKHIAMIQGNNSASLTSLNKDLDLWSISDCVSYIKENMISLSERPCNSLHYLGNCYYFQYVKQLKEAKMKKTSKKTANKLQQLQAELVASYDPSNKEFVRPTWMIDAEIRRLQQND